VAGFRLIAGCLLGLSLLACDRNENVPQAVGELRPQPACDPVARVCEANGEGIGLSFRFGPGVAALKPFPVRVWPAPGVRIEKLVLSFRMSGMDMGLNRYRLVEQPDGAWQAGVTLPVCTSGRTDWFVDLELWTDAGLWRGTLPFTLLPR